MPNQEQVVHELTINANSQTYKLTPKIKSIVLNDTEITPDETGEVDLGDITSCTTANVKAALGTTSGTVKFLREDGTWQVSPYMMYGVHYIEGPSTDTTAGTWTGTLENLTAYYNGLTIMYVPAIAGATTTTLNLNELGAITCYYNSNTKLTTQYAVGTPILLTYVNGAWKRADYDSNTTAISNLINNGGTHVADSLVTRYQLLFSIDENTLTPLTNADNNTGTGKTMLTNVEFDAFGRFYYYTSTTNIGANGAIGAGSTAWAWNGIDLRYTFNCAKTLTAHKPLYLIVSPTTNGKCKIASTTPWTHTLPSTNDGYWYILLGRTYSTYQMYMFPFHPVYKHNGTKVIQVYPDGVTLEKSVPANAVFTDTTYENKTAVSGGTDVSLVTTGEKYTWNNKGNGTVTGVKVNGTTKSPTSGVVDIGTVITDVSGKSDKTATVSTVTYDTTNKKITKTINGTTTDIVAVSTLKTDMALAKGDVGLGNVENKSSATIRGELTSSNVTTALGYTPYNSTNPNGYTTNTGTVTGVKVNGTTINPTSGIVDIGTVLTSYTETDPTVPSWAKASSKPTYTASEVGAAPSSTVSCTTANVKSALGTTSGTTNFLREDGTWQPVSISDPGTKIYFATCSSAADASVKTIVCNDIPIVSLYGNDVIKPGTRLCVHFQYRNTYRQPRLSVEVNGTAYEYPVYTIPCGGVMYNDIDFVCGASSNQWNVIGARTSENIIFSVFVYNISSLPLTVTCPQVTSYSVCIWNDIIANGYGHLMTSDWEITTSDGYFTITGTKDSGTFSATFIFYDLYNVNTSVTT